MHRPCRRLPRQRRDDRAEPTTPSRPPHCRLPTRTPQVLQALGYYFGVVGIEDQYVVSNITGVPTYLLHDFVGVRAPDLH